MGIYWTISRVTGTFVSRWPRVQAGGPDKWLYQSIRSDKNFTIDRRFPRISLSAVDVRSPLRLMDTHQRLGRPSITILETASDSLIADFVFFSRRPIVSIVNSVALCSLKRKRIINTDDDDHRSAKTTRGSWRKIRSEILYKHVPKFQGGGGGEENGRRHGILRFRANVTQVAK